jgi:DNA polymerase V
VIAVLDGDLTVKRLIIDRYGVILRPENPAFADIRVPELAQMEVWGVVKMSLHYLVDHRRAQSA